MTLRPPMLLTVFCALTLGWFIGKQSKPGNGELKESKNLLPRPSRRPTNLNHPNTLTLSEKTHRIETWLGEMILLTDDDASGDPSLDAIGKLIDAMSLSDMEDAVEKITTMHLSHGKNQVVLRRLFQHWAELDGQSAMEYIVSHPDVMKYRWLDSQTLGTWANNSPYEAEAWFDQVQDTLSRHQQSELLRPIIQALARVDFTDAMAKAKSFYPLQKTDILVALAKSAAQNEQHMQTFSTYASSIQNIQQRTTVINALIDSLVYRNEAAKAAQVIESWPHQDKKRLTQSLIDSWARTEPLQAISWLYNQPTTPEEPAHDLSPVISKWVYSNPTAANQWINEHPDTHQDNLRLSGIHTLLHFTNNLPEARQWASQMQSEPKRRYAYRIIYFSWRGHDPAGAAEWLSTLPADTQASMIQSK